MFSVKMSRVFSALLLVCVCACSVCVSASRADLPREFGVKLCGREFIRAVIFTCGGSRWRRATTHSGEMSLERRDEFSVSEDAPLLSDLLRLQTDARVATLFSSRPERRKRNFSLGLAGLCCNQGCTKHDIGRLC
ncbi:prorelaxin H1 [Triplophysa dalaica]|uniref:prorelaxin H1 n=1 Tax=Triplophysa dalaica TaxID=1582913 RepID=UPI0024E01650|nr:prorelaxin H1 [Triplophysa dalaica]